jgi:hypothetical protein
MYGGGVGAAIRVGSAGAFAGNTVQQGIDVMTGAQNGYSATSALTATLGGGTAAGVLKPFAGTLTPSYAPIAQGLLTKYANGTIIGSSPTKTFSQDFSTGQVIGSTTHLDRSG